jgi:hypothetical protein
MGQRSRTPHPIWDNNTTTTAVGASGDDHDITIPANCYYIAFHVDGVTVFIRDDAATTASTGVKVEDGAGGNANFGTHTEQGTIIRVTRPSSVAFSYTTYFNKG